MRDEHVSFPPTATLAATEMLADDVAEMLLSQHRTLSPEAANS